MPRMQQRTGETTKCPLCREETTRYLTGGDYGYYNCRHCGPFWISGSASAVMEQRNLTLEQREHLLESAPVEDGFPYISTQFQFFGERIRDAARVLRRGA